MKQLVCVVVCITAMQFCAHAQTKEDTLKADLFQRVSAMPAKAFGFLHKKYTGLTDDIDKQTLKLVQRMQRREEKLRKKLAQTDSAKAAQLFVGTGAKYRQLEAKLQSPVDVAAVTRLKQYIPGLDSMGTAMHFLSANNSLPADKLAEVQGVSSQLQQLEGRMQQAGEAQDFVRQREQQLKDQLAQYNFGGQLLGINKQVYYYQQQLQQYKDLANDPEKLGEAVLSKLQQLPAFQSFWQKNSLLAQLFPMPQNYGTPAALTGLQTRAQVQSIIGQRLPAAAGGAGGDPSQFLQQQLQQAQSQLNTLKDKLNQLGGGSGSGNMTMPDFAPNTQHNKSFLQRLTYGYNLQTSAATAQLPAISDLGLSVGYKLSDKATVGTGISYKLGLGRGFNHIAISNQGVGLRSYIDVKVPQPKSRVLEWAGNLWITGGYEYNYLQAFNGLRDLRQHIDVWQKSALLGVTKKYKIGKKEGNMQLLYDFLASREVPRGKQVVFRVGYGF